MDPSVLQLLAERLNLTFSAARMRRSGGPGRERALFEPEPCRTLLQAVCRLGIARELEELEAVAALPLPIQLAVREAIRANLSRSRPAPMHWSWLPGPGYSVGVHQLGDDTAEIEVRLRSPLD